MDLDQFIDAIADRLAAKIAEKLRTNTDRAPVGLKEAAKLTGKSDKHLRNEVNAGRIKRVPGTHKILIPFPEIERIRNGELISK